MSQIEPILRVGDEFIIRDSKTGKRIIGHYETLNAARRALRLIRSCRTVKKTNDDHTLIFAAVNRQTSLRVHPRRLSQFFSVDQGL
jgi:hypothetical protein